MMNGKHNEPVGRPMHRPGDRDLDAQRTSRRVCMGAVGALLLLQAIPATAALTAYATWNDPSHKGWDRVCHGGTSPQVAIGGPPYPQVDELAGKWGGALVDRAGESGIYLYANVGGNRALNDKEGTIEFWWKPNFPLADSGDHPIIFVQSQGWRGLRVSVNYARDELVADFYDPNIQQNAIKTNASDLKDDWNHITYVWEDVGDRSTTRLYVNGKKVGENTGIAVRWEDDCYVFLGNLQMFGHDSDAAWDSLAIHDTAIYGGGTYGVPTEEIPEPGFIAGAIGFGIVWTLARRRRGVRERGAFRPATHFGGPPFIGPRSRFPDTGRG